MITLNVTDKIEIFLSGEENTTQPYAVSKRFTVYTKPQQIKSKSVRILSLLILTEWNSTHSNQNALGPIEGAAEETQVTEVKMECEYIGQLHTSNLLTRIVGRKFQIGHTFKTQPGRTKELEQTFNSSQDWISSHSSDKKRPHYFTSELHQIFMF